MLRAEDRLLWVVLATRLASFAWWETMEEDLESEREQGVKENGARWPKNRGESRPKSE